MQIDRQQFMEDGYLILRNVVPPGLLDAVRAAVEHMVANRRQLSAQLRLPNQPPGGTWAAAGQPRLNFATDCDAQSALAVEFLLGETTLGVCRQLIDAEHVALHYMACICSADEIESGPAAWHRDIGPGDPAPLNGMIANMQHHGPSYLQWNIALYPDSVFWIVPRSHTRVNTQAENDQLRENPRTPLPDGMAVEMGPGDGVVYTHLLLHWGSHYSTNMRRTIHPGYRPIHFGKAMPNVHWRHWQPSFYHHLSPAARQQFETWDQLYLEEFDRIADLFHAVVDGDGNTFSARFADLHASPHEPLVSLVMLTKMAHKLHRLKHNGESADALWGIGRDFEYLGSLFSDEQVATLWQRFDALEQKLKLPQAVDHPAFQRGHSPYADDDMPADFTLEDFVASWNGDAA